MYKEVPVFISSMENENVEVAFPQLTATQDTMLCLPVNVWVERRSQDDASIGRRQNVTLGRTSAGHQHDTGSLAH
jgi:hypothetical protein